MTRWTPARCIALLILAVCAGLSPAIARDASPVHPGHTRVVAHKIQPKKTVRKQTPQKLAARRRPVARRLHRQSRPTSPAPLRQQGRAHSRTRPTAAYVPLKRVSLPLGEWLEKALTLSRAAGFPAAALLPQPQSLWAAFAQGGLRENLHRLTDEFPLSDEAGRARLLLALFEEEAAWRQALDSHTGAAFRAYLRLWPQGVYRSRAARELIRPGVTSPLIFAPAPNPGGDTPEGSLPVAGSPSDAMKAGQRIMIGFVGDSTQSSGFVQVLADLEAGRIGGVLFMRGNITSRASVRAMTDRLKQCRCAWPPLLAVDEEGGKVERLVAANGFLSDPSARALATRASPARQAAFATLAREVAEAGFNLNFGPVVDLDINPANPVVGEPGRSYGRNPALVYNLAREFILAHRAQGVLTVLKHFPGHGSSQTDPHAGLASVAASWSLPELGPYALLIGDNLADAVMVGHVSSDLWGGVATLAPSTAISGLLRVRLGFDNVVVSDDLDMGAVRKSSPDAAMAVSRAAISGNDLLIFSNVVSGTRNAGAMMQAVLLRDLASGTLPRPEFEKSFARILALKARLGRPPQP